MIQSTEQQAQQDMREREVSSTTDWENFFAVYISSHQYDKLLVMQIHPAPKIWFKNQEIEYTDLIKFLESLEIKNK